MKFLADLSDEVLLLSLLACIEQVNTAEEVKPELVTSIEKMTLEAEKRGLIRRHEN